MGKAVGAEPGMLRNAYASTNQSHDDLSPHKEPEAVQLLLGHSKLESTVRYLGIEVDDALEMAEQTEV
jgi:site-specific recombinase XerC